MASETRAARWPRKRNPLTIETIDQPNGIHLKVRASTGTARAGKQWIPVPSDGVPADLLSAVVRYLDTCDVRRPDHLWLEVNAATWDSVRDEITAITAKAAVLRAAATEKWRAGAARYLAGADVSVDCVDANGNRNGPLTRAHIEYESFRSVDVTEAEQLAVVAEYQRRKAEADRKAESARLAARGAVVAILSRILAGEGVIHYERLKINGREYERHLLTAEEKALVAAEAGRREKAETAIRKAKLDAREADRNNWIAEHGSSRLQKCVAQGIKYEGIYNSERLAHDLPGWEFWGDVVENESNDAINPTEEQIDALIAARETWPNGDVRLRSIWVGEEDVEPDYSTVLMMDCPWNGSVSVLKRL